MHGGLNESAQTMSDLLNIEINGIPLQVKPGKMVIEVADDAGIVIPRFCYHKKLSVAANCRMCLVDIENARKPVPACATPVTDGMKVYTKSAKAIDAQKSIMEFLLINHPLDCPICDQGGECDLQDIAMGFGRDDSRFHEQKRVVRDKYIGPLISTDMTRCIHCTRCVRFGKEIAGIMELGAPGRGEHMEINTYMESAVGSEMSGNVIDLCPVGALTSRPYRYTGRPWENATVDAIAAHDCVGSNVQVQVRRNKVMRVLPRENEAINELWLSDRDRFSYTGLYSDERLTQPMIKQGDEWKVVEWQSALEYACEGLQRVKQNTGAETIGALASPGSTTEEFYLLQKLMRGLGSGNIDHRLQQMDFSEQDKAPIFPYLGQSLAELENLDAALLIGSYVRKDQPIIGHRLRKAARNGARISAVNSIDYDFNFALAQSIVVNPLSIVSELAAIVKALAQATGKAVPDEIARDIADVAVNSTHQAIADDLKQDGHKAVLIGVHAMSNPQFAILRSLANAIADMCGARLGYLPAGANSAGACLAGALPHRGPAAQPVNPGKHAMQMISEDMHAFILMHIEPEYDCVNPSDALSAVNNADFVICLTSYVTDTMRQYADVLLPVSAFAETAGTYVNVEGRWQSFSACVAPYEQSRPAWKVLRVMGNFLKVPGFDYVTSEEVRDELDTLSGGLRPDARSEITPVSLSSSLPELTRIGHLPLYAVDALVRRAMPLQQTSDSLTAMIAVNQATADKLGLKGSDSAVVVQNNQRINVPLYIVDAIPDNCAFMPAGVLGTKDFGGNYGAVEVDAG
jgi:NADH-quinone oxidoreductase subunit G